MRDTLLIAGVVSIAILRPLCCVLAMRVSIVKGRLLIRKLYRARERVNCLGSSRDLPLKRTLRLLFSLP